MAGGQASAMLDTQVEADVIALLLGPPTAIMDRARDLIRGVLRRRVVSR